MISSLLWIRKGVAAQHPEKYNLDDKEFDRINQLVEQELEDAKIDLTKAEEAMAVDHSENEDDDGVEGNEEEEESDEEDSAMEGDKSLGNGTETPAKPRDVNDLSEYNLDSYEDEVEDSRKQQQAIFSNGKDLSYYTNNEEDPNITEKSNIDEEEEEEELEILPTDNLLLSGKTEDEISCIEVQVYEEEEDNLYVHHDIMLPSFPLCLEWIDFHTGAKLGRESNGNYVAVGTFDPNIEIWDLDVVDPLFPATVLGHTDKTKKRSKKKNDKYHIDAILGLSWNKNHRNFILSSSADQTVKLWDLTTSKCMQSYTHHQDKVQSVAWHPTEATVFISGSYDKTVCVLDARSPQQVTRWKMTSDVEALRWDPHNSTHFYAATDDGLVCYYDVRNAKGEEGGDPVYRIHAHDEAVSALDVNPSIPGCIVTGGTDKSVKLWNTSNNKPSMIASRNFELGKIFTAQFCPDSPFHLAIGGSKGKVHVWNTKSKISGLVSAAH